MYLLHIGILQTLENFEVWYSSFWGKAVIVWRLIIFLIWKIIRHARAPSQSIRSPAILALGGALFALFNFEKVTFALYKIRWYLCQIIAWLCLQWKNSSAWCVLWFWSEFSGDLCSRMWVMAWPWIAPVAFAQRDWGRFILQGIFVGGCVLVMQPSFCF